MNAQVPDLVEKLKFWEEQDRINQALIPRVVKLSDLLKDIAKKQEQTPGLLAALEARVTARLADVQNPPAPKASAMPLVALAMSGAALLVAILALFR